MAFSETNLKWNYLESLKTWVPMIFSGAIQLAGVPSPVAEILKEVLAGFLEGTSIKDEESYQQFQASWQTGLPGLLEEHKDQLAPYLVEMLKIVFEPKAYLEILSTKDPEAALEQAMRLACLRDKSASLWKLGKDNIQNMVKEIISASMNQIEGDPVFLQAVQDKQWFARHFRTNPHTANADYALSFAAPLFLHKGSPDGWRVSLRNLYVMPKYKEVYIKDDLEARLTSFIRGDIPFLLIEGDAGTGKTTLAAWLNYHYVLGDKPKLFADRPLVTVRLRDLDGQSVTAGKTFTGAVLDYLQLEGNINRLPPNAVLLLDGFDELCMIEKATVQQEEFFMPLYRAAKRKGFKVILTSRPTVFSCDIPKKERYLQIALQHFDETKRKEWCDLYTGPCGQTLDKKVGDYIAQIDDKDDNKVSCVCDTPMTLYMLAAGNETENYLNNDWALYRHIFMDALSETDYNEMQSDKECDLQHGIHPYRELLYRISENIAFEMFQMGNTAFSLTEKPIQKIIADLKLEKNANETDQDCQKLTESTEAILEKCYGLCCYWKTGGQKGAVEFLHNTIRDFFLAEYFCRRLDAMAWAMNKSGENKIEQLTDLLARLLWYAELEPNVLYFAYQRALYNKQEGTRDYASWEASHHKIKDILDDLSDKGILRNAAKFCEEEKAKSDKVNLHWCTLNIVKNTIMLYRVAYEPHLKKDMYICWCDWTRGKNDLVYALFAEIFGNDPFCCFNEGHSAKCGVMPFGLGSRAVFTGPYKVEHPVFYKKTKEKRVDRTDEMELDGMNLSCANLRGSNLHWLFLRKANLHMSDLGEANLSGANLSGADLSGADLEEAELENAKLFRANLREANLLEVGLTKANLQEANLTGSCLHEAYLYEANLTGANLFGANLTGADLTRANLTGADLTGADLTGADLTETKLCKVCIRETDLNEVNLTGADLTGADLTGAKLSKVKLSNAILCETDLNHSDLTETDLREANLFGAKLSEANLSGMELSVVDLSKINLSEANLTSANLIGANLHEAYLRDADLHEANLQKADLHKANLTRADLRMTNLSEANLTRVDLHKANLQKADLCEADLTEANLTEADLSYAKLTGAKLTGVKLTGVNLTGVELHGADLRGYDLQEAELIGTYLCGANLSGVKLNRADLTGVDLTGVNLRGADLHGAELSNADLRGANLIRARLPDGFQSDKQDEQIRHLMERDIGDLLLDDPGSVIVHQIQENNDAMTRDIFAP